MRKFYFLGLVLIGLAGCQTPQTSSVSRSTAAASLADVPYNFDATKVQRAKNAYVFARSFVDYFYLILAENKSRLAVVRNFSPFSGKCVGDAHPENFGFLILENGDSKFSVNDIDDFGPCPVAYDLFRLMTTAYAYDARTDLAAILNSYALGLSGGTMEMPAPVLELRGKSVSRGKGLHPRRVAESKLVRDKAAREVAEPLAAEIKSLVVRLNPGAEALDVIETIKESGGSGGLTRYQVLVKLKNDFVHLELKEQIRPAIYPVATAPLPSLGEKIANALKTEQGPGVSHFYKHAVLQGKDMLVRPIFWGDVGANLGQHIEENQELENFEAFVLGQIHRGTVVNLGGYLKALRESSPGDWLEEAHNLSVVIEQRYKTLRAR